MSEIVETIPKIIHYVWLGGRPLGKNEQRCLDSWKKHCPDYTIMCWCEDNFDFNSCPWAREALAKKKYAFAADAIRLWAVYTYGGIYFDTDVYLKGNLDTFLTEETFFGYESGHGLWLGTAVFGAVKQNAYIKYLYSYYNRSLSTKMAQAMPVTYLTRLYYPDFKTDGRAAEVSGEGKPNLKIYPHDIFYAKDYMTGSLKPTQNTVAVHEFVSSWWSKGQKRGAGIARLSRKILGRHIFKLFERIVKRYQMGSIKRQLKCKPLTEYEENAG